ncbi:hypothetical protein [Nostoc spongiaeforme]|nr:hypothetical protein [Nostoc spongiaeforme]
MSSRSYFAHEKQRRSHSQIKSDRTCTIRNAIALVLIPKITQPEN